MKIITKIALVVLIVGFPLASWYYLNTGLEFRKQAIRDLKPKGEWVVPGLDNADFQYKTSVVFMDSLLRRKMAMINDQYSTSNTFQMVEIVMDHNYDAAWKTIRVGDDFESYDSLSSHIFLLDTEGLLRSTYGKTDKDLGKLVEHIAIVLPRDVEPDIKMRQNEGK